MIHTLRHALVFFLQCFKNYHHNFEQKIKYFKDHGRDIRSQNLKHTFS